MIVTLFSGMKDNQGIAWDVEPAEFLATLATPTIALPRVEKATALAFAGCRFEGTRAKSNARDLEVVALDVDDGTTDLFDARWMLDDLGCAYVLYTTTKHRRECARYRIVLPLSSPAQGDAYERLWDALARHFARHGIVLDNATRDISRMSITPHAWTGDDDKGGSYHPEDDGEIVIHRPSDTLLDPLAMIAAYPPIVVPEPVVLASSPSGTSDMQKWANWHVSRDVLADLDNSPIVPRARLDRELSASDSGRTYRFLTACAVKAVAGGYDVDETVLLDLGQQFSRRVGRKTDGLRNDVRNALRYACRVI